MKKLICPSLYEAPECEVITVEVETVFLESDPARVTVDVPEVEDSGYSYEF